MPSTPTGAGPMESDDDDDDDDSTILNLFSILRTTVMFLMFLRASDKMQTVDLRIVKG